MSNSELISEFRDWPSKGMPPPWELANRLADALERAEAELVRVGAEGANCSNHAVVLQAELAQAKADLVFWAEAASTLKERTDRELAALREKEQNIKLHH
jgi:hypothetical protein